MKNIFTSMLVLGLACSSVMAAKEKTSAMTPEMERKMEMMKDAAKVGEGHKVFANAAGKWSYTSNWWETPEAQPQESKGKASMKLVMDGRFLEQEMSGTSMGEKFKGHGYLGFDNTKSQYESVWMDNMSTGIMKSTGSYDASTKTITETGEFTDPTAANKLRKFKGEWTFVDKNHMTYKMNCTDATGKDLMKMEIHYKRL